MFTLNPAAPEPMQVGHTQTSTEEQQYRKHYAFSCPEKPVAWPDKVSRLAYLFSVQLPIQIHYDNNFSYVSALMDSGLAINIIHC